MWAVGVSCTVSVFTVLGFVLQTTAVRSAEQRAKHMKVGELVFSPMWFAGMFLQVVPNFLGDVIAYTIAPISLTAPLSGVSVVANMLLAPCLLGERWCPWPDIPATILIMFGVVLTTVTGDHKDATHTHQLAQAGELCKVPLTIQVFSILLITLAVCELRQRSRRVSIEARTEANFDAPQLSHLILPAWSAAGVGCVTNIGLKIFGELVSGEAAWLSVLLSLLVFVVPSALYQQQALNRGLRLYPQAIFFPIYSSLLVLTNTFFGAAFFKEYEALLKPGSSEFFLLGIACVVCGICLFSQRSVPEKPKAAEGKLAEPMLGVVA
jgi:hypothetical protein